METIVVSDVHLGSHFCNVEAFLRFLQQVPDGCRLVLNGDILDHWHRRLPETHQKALDTLREESLHRDIVWVRGNNDQSYVMEDSRGIEFVSSYSEEGKLFVSHGDEFDRLMHKNILFTWPFKVLHRLWLLCGVRPMHVAAFAKRCGWLYGILRQHVIRNTVRYAQAHAYPVVISGHTHFVEDAVVDGVRYLNTGSWTEEPLSCVAICNGDITLCDINSSGDILGLTENKKPSHKS